MRRATWLLALLLQPSAPALRAQRPVRARVDSVRSSPYADTIAALGRVARTDSSWMTAQRELARALATTGKYGDAETVARQAIAAPGGRELLNTLGEIERDRGRRASAESLFVRAVAERASDSLTAALNVAVLHFNAGDRDRAAHEFAHFIDVYNARAPSLTSRELTAVAIACRYLGADNPQLFKDALKAFDRAIATDNGNLDARVALGELFLEKYNGADAERTFGEVLALNPFHPRALLGEAKRLSFDGQPGADSLLARALEVNPNFTDGRVTLARALVDIEDYAGAQREVDRALATNPVSLDALAVAAAIKYVLGDQPGYEAIKGRALALNPHDGEFFATMADVAGHIRLYTVAAGFAREGVAADPKNWRAQGLLGMNLLRLGRIEDGKKSLDVAFAGDPYDVWIKNTLDLLDTFKNYDLVASDRFRFMIEKDESALLSVYLTDLAERAYDTYARKYAFNPAPPIRIEVYRSHTDFSVRTVGLAGLGALGVSFGTTLAFDSPAAKDAGPFNWGSTVWHELAHTFTLGLTENRVPRWLSEGLSVYEEHAGRSGWGMQSSPDFLDAFRDGKLAPVSRMNDGFMRPTYPAQVQYSYYEASLFCDFVAQGWGEKALLGLLLEYKAGRNTEQAFQKVLGADPKAIDKRFDTYVRQRFAGPLAALAGGVAADALAKGGAPAEVVVTRAEADKGNYRLQMLAAGALIQLADTTKAIALFERARALIPDDGEADGANGWLAHLYIARKEPRKAADALAQLVARNESDLGAYLELARLFVQLGEQAKAADVLEGAMYINPFDIARHQQLADLYQHSGDKAKAVRERKAVVALNPVDRADALYRLALAQHDAGDDGGARLSVLRSLEEAPNYAAAQDLLLAIVDARKP